MWLPIQLCMYVHLFKLGLTDLSTSFLVVLVMGDTGFLGGHPNRGGHDSAGVWSPYWAPHYIGLILCPSSEKRANFPTS